VAEGEFHECLNLAALWRLPVLFCCENNRYAMGTALEREHAATDLAARAASYSMPSRVVDGMDVVEVANAAQEAVAAVRAGGGPYFLELQTYRFRAHSMYDPDRYRDKAEIAAWKKRDPVAAMLAHETDLDALEQEIAEEIDAAVRAAEAAPLEPVSDLTRHVYAEASA
jgi:pyruvate dehydrogenase E1 component subunit alpha